MYHYLVLLSPVGVFSPLVHWHFYLGGGEEEVSLHHRPWEGVAVSYVSKIRWNDPPSQALFATSITNHRKKLSSVTAVMRGISHLQVRPIFTS